MIFDRPEVRTIGMCMFGKTFGNKQGSDPRTRDPTNTPASRGRSPGRRQALRSGDLLPNVHDGRLVSILYRFLKGKLPGFHSPDRNPAAPSELGQGWSR